MVLLEIESTLILALSAASPRELYCYIDYHSIIIITITANNKPKHEKLLRRQLIFLVVVIPKIVLHFIIS